MPTERILLTLSIQARCETLARHYLRSLSSAEREGREGLLPGPSDIQVAALKEKMLEAVTFAFEEFPSWEGPSPDELRQGSARALVGEFDPRRELARSDELEAARSKLRDALVRTMREFPDRVVDAVEALAVAVVRGRFGGQ